MENKEDQAEKQNIQTSSGELILGKLQGASDEGYVGGVVIGTMVGFNPLNGDL